MSDQFELVPRFADDEDSFTLVELAEDEENNEVDGFVLAGDMEPPVDDGSHTSDAPASDADRSVSRTQAGVTLIDQTPGLEDIAQGHVWKLSLLALVMLLLCYDSVLNSTKRSITPNPADSGSSGSSSSTYDSANWPQGSGVELGVGYKGDKELTDDNESTDVVPSPASDVSHYDEIVNNFGIAAENKGHRDGSSNVPSPRMMEDCGPISTLDFFAVWPQSNNTSLWNRFWDRAPRDSLQDTIPLLAQGPVPMPRFFPVKSREISILTPYRVPSRVEGAPQPNHRIAWQKQPAFIPVRSLIPFAAPRPSPAPTKEMTITHRLIPVPSKRRGIVTDLTPTFNVTGPNVSRPVTSYLKIESIQSSQRQTKSSKTTVVLTQLSFDDFLRQHSRAFVIFYYPCSSYERLLVPVWTKFTKLVMGPIVKQGDFQTGTVDCLAYPKVCDSQSISRFPTLRWFEDGRAVYGDYKGRRTVAKLLTYALVRLHQDESDETVDTEPPLVHHIAQSS